MMWLLALLLLLPAIADAQTTRYASPTGTGAAPCTTNSSAAAMCPTVTAINATVAGDTVELAPGMYQGQSYMIDPQDGKSGLSGSPITVKAATDGTVTLDGEFLRRPVTLNNNSWWIFEGFNARHGDASAVVYYTGNSSNNIMRRVVAWDAKIDGNNNVIGVHGGSNNLFEDVAAFGPARKVFSNSQGGNSVTCRRCWIRWEANIFGSPLGATFIYNSTGAVIENSLFTWSGESMPHTFFNVNPAVPLQMTDFNPQGAVGILAVDRIDSATTPKHANAAARASIVYTKATDRMPTSPATGGVPGLTMNGLLVWGASSVTLGDIVRVMDPAHSRFNEHIGVGLVRRPQNCPSGGPSTCEDPVVNNTATRITSIRGTKAHGGNTGDSFGTLNVSGKANETDWTVANSSVGTSLGVVQSPWQNTSTDGARVCFQMTNGVVDTGTKLWPWPMNERIKAATASAGAFGAGYSFSAIGCVRNGVNNCCEAGSNPPTTCTPFTFPARTETDVTADIETLLGTIPSACKTTASAPSFPTVSPTFPAVSTPLDAFDGTGALSGWTTISGNGWERVSGVAQPISGASTVFYDPLFDSDQEAWCEIGPLPNLDGEGLFVMFGAVDNANRYRVDLRRVTGANNDTIKLDKLINLKSSVLVPETSLGIDVVAGDTVGARRSGTTLTLVYCPVSAGVCWEIGTVDEPTFPASSHLGLRADVAGCTAFGGDGVASGADVTAPTAPGTPVIVAQNVSQIEATWPASTDAVGVTAYIVYRGVVSDCSDCAEIAQTSLGPQYVDSNVSPSTTYYYRFKASDAAGNLSAFSSIGSGRTPDTAAYSMGSGKAP